MYIYLYQKKRQTTLFLKICFNINNKKNIIEVWNW